jgi:predicted MFS family arabinose efflux permease
MESKSRWGVVAAFALAVAATQMVWLTFAPVTTVAADKYAVSEAAIGWLANVFVLGFVLLAIPAGFLIDRNLRGALLLGAVITAVGACLRLGGDSFNWMLSGACVAALGQPILLTGIIGLTRGYLRPEHRPAGIAAATAATWAGFVGAFALSAAFSDAGSLPNLVAAHAAYAVSAAIALAIALRTPAPFANLETSTGTRVSLAAVRAAWSDSLVRRLCLFAFIPFGTFIALTTWTQALLEPADVTVDQVGVILICCVLAGVLGTAVIPVVAVRRRREVRAGVIATVVTTMACGLLAAAPGFGMGLVCLSLAGLLLLPMLAIILELVERHTGGDTDGISSGLVWTLGNLGGLVVTGIVGFTLDSPTVSFLILGAVTLLALPLLARLRSPIAALPSSTPTDSPSDTDPSQHVAR